MSFDEGNLAGRESRSRVCATDHLGLSFGAGLGDSTLAIGGDAPAANRRVHVVAVRPGVLESFQGHESATFTRDESASACVVHVHVATGQCTQTGESHQFQRIQADVDSPCQDEVGRAGRQLFGCSRHREHSGRARTVHDVPAAVEVEIIADPAGNRIRQHAGESVFTRLHQWALVDLFHRLGESIGDGTVQLARFGCDSECALDVRPTQTHRPHPGFFTGEGVADDCGAASSGYRSSAVARVGQSPECCFQSQPVCEICRLEGPLRYPATDPVEFETIHERAAIGVCLVDVVRARAPVVVEGHP